MSEIDPQLEVGLTVFERMVQTRSPDEVQRDLATLQGEEFARRVRFEWERRAGLVARQVDASTIRGRKRRKPWYVGPRSDAGCWPSLRRHLVETKGWSEEVVEDLDRESTRVVGLLDCPTEPVDVKGLVIGYVQSGKTANYTAVIAKAIDAGYRLVIVLAGIHNGLRAQTQKRLESELVHVEDRTAEQWIPLTSVDDDFEAPKGGAVGYLTGDRRILAVVKKNAMVLEKLVSWLEAANEAARKRCPALIIDDEADQAGLNTAPEDEPRTRINELILRLKDALPSSAYVAYTATPFANVLVDPSGKDLYPEDFITALKKPVGYFGAEEFFGRDLLDGEELEEDFEPPDMFREVPEEDVRAIRPMKSKEVEDFDPFIPPSLDTALRYFLMAAAARRARGQTKRHTSMLVHPAVQTKVHSKVTDCVKRRVKAMQSELGTGARKKWQVLWEEEHRRVRVDGREPVPFDEVWKRLPEVFERLNVVEDNAVSEERLYYKAEGELTDEDPTVHIAIGGNTLSRGLTLEGLVVSYFVRGGNTYDTLLQMGRWFGYRHGYEDLPRIWMTMSLRNDFRDLATVEAEIRREVDRYAEEGLSPRELAVRIRTHPTMLITSRMKMRRARVVKVDYSGSSRQTGTFKKDSKWLEANWQAGERLFERLKERHGSPHRAKRGEGYYFTGVQADEVIRFLEEYECHESHADLARQALVEFLREAKVDGTFVHWTVGLKSTPTPSKRRARLIRRFEPLGVDIGLAHRTIKSDSDTEIRLEKVAGSDDFDIDGSMGGKESKSIRPVGSQPLLVLLPVEPIRTKGEVDEEHRQVLGIALGFPGVGVGRKHTYVAVELSQQPEAEEEFAEEEVA